MIFVSIQYFEYSNGQDIIFEWHSECSCLIHKHCIILSELHHDVCTYIIKMCALHIKTSQV
jgi:hypothetical protein